MIINMAIQTGHHLKGRNCQMAQVDVRKRVMAVTLDFGVGETKHEISIDKAKMMLNILKRRL